MSHPSPEALEELALDPSRGTAADRTHLATCGSCQARVRDAAGRRALLRGLRPHTLSDMGFRRVEARLMETLEKGTPPRVPWRWLAYLALGLMVVAFVQLRPRRVDSPVARGRGVERPHLPPARVEPLTVLLASADAKVQGVGPPASAGWGPLTVGQVVESGEHVQGRAVGLRPASGVEWAFELKGSLGVGEGASLMLTSGELVAHVSGTEVDIVLGGLHVVAVDAVFSLERTLAEVVVEVEEGMVELVDSSFERRQVRAPSRLRLGDGATLSAAVAESPRGVRRLAAPPQPWVHFDAMSLPQGTRLSLDGVFLGEAPLSALVASGRHRLGVASPGQVMHESWVELSGRYVVKLGNPAPRVGPAVPAVEPDEAEVASIQAELKRQRPKLTACYEKWLKANPEASAEVELVLVVSASGRVREASVKGGLLGEPAECLVRTAKALSLPALGREVEIELPLRLTTLRE